MAFAIRETLDIELCFELHKPPHRMCMLDMMSGTFDNNLPLVLLYSKDFLQSTIITQPPSSLIEGQRYITDGVRLAQRHH
jgi:hypothetical protein